MSKVRLRIAVVDDEEPIRKAMQRLLRSAMMDVETFPSGAEFLDAIRHQKPDCVVMDLHMPGMNGFDVLQHLTQSGTKLPVIIITGHDTPEARARCMEWGVTQFLPKPVDDLVLLEAIAAGTSRHD